MGVWGGCTGTAGVVYLDVVHAQPTLRRHGRLLPRLPRGRVHQVLREVTEGGRGRWCIVSTGVSAASLARIIFITQPIRGLVVILDVCLVFVLGLVLVLGVRCVGVGGGGGGGGVSGGVGGVGGAHGYDVAREFGNDGIEAAPVMSSSVRQGQQVSNSVKQHRGSPCYAKQCQAGSTSVKQCQAASRQPLLCQAVSGRVNKCQAV